MIKKFREPKPRRTLRQAMDAEIQSEAKAKEALANYRDPDKDTKTYNLPEINYKYFKEKAEQVEESCKIIDDFLHLPFAREMSKVNLDNLAGTLRKMVILLNTRALNNCQEQVFEVQNYLRGLLQIINDTSEEAPDNRRKMLSSLKKELQYLLYYINNAAEAVTDDDTIGDDEDTKDDDTLDA